MPGNRQITLAGRPDGMVAEACFAEVDGDIPTPGAGQMLVRTRYLTIDPATRGWLNERGSGYLPGVELGAPVRSNGLGEVVVSNADGYPVGSLVTSLTGWQEYSIAGSDMVNQPFEYATVVPDGVDPIEFLCVLSNTGWTAYAAVERVLQPRNGEAMLITSGASQVGSIAGQLAKKRGAFVVGTAGSDEKCAWCVDDLGFDACINYRTEDVDQRIKALFPTGVDVLMDNVGGSLLDTILRRVAVGSRLLLVGSLSVDNATEPYRLANYDRLMSRRATMMGFNTIDHLDLAPESTAAFRRMLDQGTISYRADVLQGLSAAPAALVDLYGAGGHRPGKMIIEV